MSRGLPKKVKPFYFTSEDDEVKPSEGTYVKIDRKSLRDDPHPEIKWSEYDQTLEHITDEFEGGDITVILVSLGGQVGTAVGPVVSKAAFISGASTLGFAIMPFSAEKVRHTKAKRAVGLLKEEMPNTVVLENDNLLKLAGDKTVKKALDMMDELIWKKLHHMMQSIRFHEEYKDEGPEMRVNSSSELGQLPVDGTINALA